MSEEHITPSGLILTHDGTDYPVMLDLTDGYKLTCKEVTDDEWPDILCLISFAKGPLNLELKVEEKEAETIKGKAEEEIITYKEMIKTAEKFINNMPIALTMLKGEQKPVEKLPWSVFTLGTARGATI
jgi:hypothetical protein